MEQTGNRLFSKKGLGLGKFLDGRYAKDFKGKCELPITETSLPFSQLSPTPSQRWKERVSLGQRERCLTPPAPLSSLSFYKTQLFSKWGPQRNSDLLPVSLSL